MTTRPDIGLPRPLLEPSPPRWHRWACIALMLVLAVGWVLVGAEKVHAAPAKPIRTGHTAGAQQATYTAVFAVLNPDCHVGRYTPGTCEPQRLLGYGHWQNPVPHPVSPTNVCQVDREWKPPTESGPVGWISGHLFACAKTTPTTSESAPSTSPTTTSSTQTSPPTAVSTPSTTAPTSTTQKRSVPSTPRPSSPSSPTTGSATNSVTPTGTGSKARTSFPARTSTASTPTPRCKPTGATTSRSGANTRTSHSTAVVQPGRGGCALIAATTATPSSRLASTGFPTAMVAWLAVAFLTVGAGLIVAGRRRAGRHG